MDFATLKSNVKAIVFPIGEPENLVNLHNAFIVDGLNTIQSYVKCFRSSNTNLTAFSDTRYNCGLTVASAPNGFIKRVYTLDSGSCCRVNYRKSTLAQLRHMEATQKVEMGETTLPDQTEKPTLAGSDLFPGAASDSSLGRAVTGYWALEGCRLYVWPHLQSTEDLVVEWEGIKDAYADADTIFDDSTLLQRAVRLYLQREIARDLTANDADLTKFGSDFALALQDLFWRCRQKLEGTYSEEDTLPVITNGCASPALNTVANTPTDVTTTPAPTWLYRFAIVGNYGNNTLNSQRVATLVNSWTPAFIATTGGNTGGTTPVVATYDNFVGTNYHQYLFPYIGTKGPGSIDRNRFWPCIANNDQSTANTFAAYRAFFNIPADAGGGRYYDHIEGPVHLLFLDSRDTTPDGNTSSSAQAEWLRVKLATSPCKFKLVFFNRTPYSSFVAQVPALRWPFKQWGATAVLTGNTGAYERLYVDGLPYLNNALGSTPTSSAPTPVLGSVFTYHAKSGAQLVTVNCDSIKLELFDVDGNLIDTVEM